MKYSGLLHSTADIMFSHPFNRVFKLKPQTSRLLLDGDDDVVAHVARTVWVYEAIVRGLTITTILRRTFLLLF